MSVWAAALRRAYKYWRGGRLFASQEFSYDASTGVRHRVLYIYILYIYIYRYVSIYLSMYPLGLLRMTTHTKIGGRPYTSQELGYDASAGSEE